MRRSLRARTILGLSGMALALTLASVVAITSLRRLGGAIAVILRENYASVIACEDMKDALEREDSAALFAASGREDIALSMLRANRARFDEAFAREARNITVPGEGTRVADIRARYRTYVRAVDSTLASPAAARRDRYFGELLPQFTAIKDVVQSVLRMNQANMELADGRAKVMARRTVRISLIVSALALVIAAVVALWLLRAALRPLRTLTEAVEAIGGGNLNPVLEVSPYAEFVPLAAAFATMATQLRTYRDSSLGELLAAQDLSRSTIECLVDPVVVFGASGEILLANHAAESAFGVRPGSAEELGNADVAIPAALAAARDRVLERGEPVAPRSFNEAVRWRATPREGDRYYLVRAVPLGTERGERRHALVVAQDVTRFRRIDELKTDMVATVSHEFKTPLTSLRMATHLLLEPATGTLTESQRELVTTARDDTERLRAMVDELLDLVRIEAEAGALRRVAFDPSGLLATVVDSHRTIARDKQVALVVADGAPTDKIRADPEKLAIVLGNLVSNAIRHTPTGGRVTLGVQRDGATVRFSVTDTGDGIQSSDLPRIFERAPAHRSAGGTRVQHGLGLTISREIVLQHGGEILARSAPGAGSTFTVVLPMDEGTG